MRIPLRIRARLQSCRKPFNQSGLQPLSHKSHASHTPRWAAVVAEYLNPDRRINSDLPGVP